MIPRRNGQRQGVFAHLGLKLVTAALLIAPALSLGSAEPVADIAFAKKNNDGQIGTEDFAAPRYRGFIEIPDNEEADPYWTTINVKGLKGFIVDVNLILLGVSHDRPSDMSVMLEHGGRSAVVMRQAGGTHAVENYDIVLDSDSTLPGLPQTEAIAGDRPYQPRDYDVDDTPFGGGAPGNWDGDNSPRQYLDVFADPDNPISANGPWTLWVRDDRAAVSGEMRGWQLEIVTSDDLPHIAKDKYKTKQGRKLRVSSNKGVLRTDPQRGQDIIAEILDKPRKGRVKLRQDGGFKYKPRGNKKGKDRFTYTITDTRGFTVIGEGEVVIKIKKDKRRRKR